MQELVKYNGIQADNFKVVWIKSDDKCVGFTVAHNDLERAVERNFDTASAAYKYGCENYKGLC